MDSYTVLDDLSVLWTTHQKQIPANKRALYHVNVRVEEENLDALLGVDQSPHTYYIMDNEKKPFELQLGNFRVEGIKLEEKAVGINRELSIIITDKNGDHETQTYSFTGIHKGDFVYKIPEVLKLMKDLNIYGSWRDMTALKKVEAENIALKNRVKELEIELTAKNIELDKYILNSDVKDEIKVLEEQSELSSIPQLAEEVPIENVIATEIDENKINI